MAGETYDIEQAADDIGDLRGQVDRLNEILQITDSGSAPNTPAASTFAMYSSAGQPAYLNPQGLGGNLSAGNAANTGGTTVTAASATNIATYVVPPGDSQAGSVYKMTCFGHGTTGTTTASNSITWDQTHGGVGGGAETTGTTFFSTSQSFRFHVQTYLICAATGASGSFWINSMVTLTELSSNILPGSAGQQAAGFAIGTSSAITVDSTVQETLRFRVAWGGTAGSPGPTLTCDAFFTERIC